MRHYDKPWLEEADIQLLRQQQEEYARAMRAEEAFKRHEALTLAMLESFIHAAAPGDEMPSGEVQEQQVQF